MNTNKTKSSVDHSITNRQLFEQNIDGLKRSLSTKSRRMSRITEIALVTNYYWTNPNPPNSNVTTTTAAKRFKLLKTINKQQQTQQYIETNNKIILHFVCFYNINIYIQCICICIVFRYQFDSINTKYFSFRMCVFFYRLTQLS